MPTGATEFVDSITADVFIPEIWYPGAIVAREDELVFARLVDRHFESHLRMGDKLNIPNISNLSARTKTKSNNSAITYETITETNQQLEVATWEYVAMAVESIIDVQADRDLMVSYSGKLGQALGQAVDDVLAGLPDNVTNTVGTLATDLDDDDFIRARQYLNDANVPLGDRVIVVSPAQEAGMLKLDRFIHSDYAVIHGGETDGLDRAYIGTFYRMPVYMSVNVEGTNGTGHDNTMFQREAFALLMQMTPKMRSMYDIDFLVDKIAVEQLYGTKQIRGDHAVFMQGA